MLLHVVAMFVIAFPAPVGGLDRSLWKEPTVQDEMVSWSKFFHVSPADFEEFLFQAAVIYMRGRDQVISPFYQYVSWTGCDQPWRMFVGPHLYPSKLQVQALKKGTWETLYEERSPEFRWHEDLFAQERMRSQIFRWALPNFGNEYQAGCTYLANLAVSEDASLESVRCRFWHVRSASPQEVRTHTEPAGAWDNVRELVVPPRTK